VQQLTRLQDQVAKLVGQINTLQDRVSVIEGRMAQLSPTSTSVAASAGGGNVVDAITSVVGAAAAQGAAAVVNRAAMKLEDMVSPGALYNLRKVSDRGPVRYAW
jgi:phage shock protein A